MKVEEFYSFLAMFDINIAEEYKKTMREEKEKEEQKNDV